MSNNHRDAALQHRRLAPVLLAAGAILLLAGCATAPPKTPEQAVAERAQARWDALVERDFGTAYTYYSPGFRSAMTLDEYRGQLSQQRVRWTGAEFLGVECQAQVCEAEFRVAYDYRMPVQGVGTVSSRRPLTESWIRADGKWYYVPAEPGGLH